MEVWQNYHRVNFFLVLGCKMYWIIFSKIIHNDMFVMLPYFVLYTHMLLELKSSMVFKSCSIRRGFIIFLTIYRSQILFQWWWIDSNACALKTPIPHWCCCKNCGTCSKSMCNFVGIVPSVSMYAVLNSSMFASQPSKSLLPKQELVT